VSEELELEDPKDLRAEIGKCPNSTNERKNMSTKTIYKRIALVAVAALGAGVLSVAPANAASNTTAITAADITMVAANADTVLAIGVCALAAAAVDSASTSALNTGSVAAVGSKLVFRTDTNGKGALVVSGPAVWAGLPSTDATLATAATAATISADAKTVGFTDDAAFAVLSVTGVGAITVTAYNAATVAAATAAVDQFGITAVAACDTRTASAANSIFVLDNGAEQAASTSTDWKDATVPGTPNYADIDAGSTVIINILLRDAYKANLGTAGALTATATNGAVVAFDAETAAASIAVLPTTGASNVELKVAQSPAAPGAPLDTVVTFAFNGVTLATKAVKILGIAKSIKLYDNTVGSTGTSDGDFNYEVNDAAGNRLLVSDLPTGTIAGVTSAGVVSAVAAGTAPTAAAAGIGSFACAANRSGSQDYSIGLVNTALELIKSNVVTFTCGSSTVDTFSLSMDKASYSPGEIATLTIAGKDSRGGIVSDAAVIGAGYANIALAGMTQIGTAASSADTFTSGKKTYKFRVDQVEGSFVGQAQATAATDTGAKTVQYKIANATGTVSNADVLKAIVSLIASINKQIAALQKALLRR
jgi:trimeric autotransporter adhesin